MMVEKMARFNLARMMVEKMARFNLARVTGGKDRRAFIKK
jgi:hypothetical protein